MKDLIPYNTPEFFEYDPGAVAQTSNFLFPLHTGEFHQTIVPVQEVAGGFLHSRYAPAPEYFPWHEDCNLTVNSHGYRCDEFTNVHDGIHILFAGCSVTFPDGLKQDEGWAWKTYSKIKENHPDIKLSGFFNLSFPGWSILEIIFNINRYIENFGKPDYLFINWPQLTRFYGVHGKASDIGIELTLATTSDNRTTYPGTEERISPNTMNRPAKMLIKYLSYHNIKMLEQMCKISDIKIKSFTWDNSGEDNLNEWASEMNFTSYVPLSVSDQQELIFDISENIKETDVSYVARDGSHPGTYFQEMWSNIAFDFFKETYEDSRI